MTLYSSTTGKYPTRGAYEREKKVPVAEYSTPANTPLSDEIVRQLRQDFPILNTGGERASLGLPGFGGDQSETPSGS